MACGGIAESSIGSTIAHYVDNNMFELNVL